MRTAVCGIFVLAALAAMSLPAVAETRSAHSWRIGDDLRGTSWQAETVDGNPVPDPAAMTIDFLKAGDQVRGQAGCNRFVGPFASRGDKVTMGILRQSREMCPAAQAEMQRTFIDMLHAAYVAKIEGRVLTFTSRQGETITLTPRPR